MKSFLTVLTAALILTSPLPAETDGVAPRSGWVEPPAPPLRFEEYPAEQGPLFLSRGEGFDLLISPDGLEIRAPGSPPATVRFVGARRVSPVGEDRLDFSTHYFLGADPDRWRPDVAAYGRVRYPAIYPDTDLLLYPTDGRIEFDFRLGAGVDPDLLRLAFAGHRALEVDTAGALRVTLDDGQVIRLRPPVAFQEPDGNRRVLPCRYEVEGEEARFALEGHDPALPLTIDPVFLFNSYLGGGQSDSLSGIVEDGAGNIYVAGWTQSVNLPAANGFQKERATGRDAFVAKLAPGGKSLVWLTYLGGAGDDQAASLKVDSQGRVIVVGGTNSRDFPVGESPLQENYGGGTNDAFVTKLNSTGSGLVYSTYLGGSADDSAVALALGADNTVFVTGTTRSSAATFQTTPGVAQPSHGGGADAFLVKLSADGATRVFSTFYGGGGNETARDVALTPDGGVVVVGDTTSVTLPLRQALQDHGGASDAFVARFTPDGRDLVFSTYLGGASADIAYAVAVDAAGAIYVGGETAGPTFPVVDPIQWNSGGGTDMFLAKIAPDHSALEFATFLGGSGFDSLRAMKLDSLGRAHIAGVTTSIDFPLVGAAGGRGAGAELVVAILDPARSLLAFSTLLGGSGTEIPSGIFLAADGRVLVSGVTDSVDLPTVEAYQEAPGGTGLFRSTNRGESWQKSGAGLEDPNVETLHVHHENSWVYAGTTNRGIYLSKDVGVTWSPIGPENRRILSIAADPESDRIVWAGTSNGLMRTTDGGETWEMISDNDTLPFGAFNVVRYSDPAKGNVLFAGHGSSGVFRSDNGGATWRAQNQGLPDAADRVVHSLAVDPLNPSKVYLGTNGTVFQSANGGDTWTETSFTGTNLGPVRALTIDPANPATVYAGVQLPLIGPTVVWTEDGGVNWHAKPPGLPGAVSALAVDTSNRIFAGTLGGGLLRIPKPTTDSDLAWTALREGLGTTDIPAFAIDRRNTTRMYVGYQSGSNALLTGLRPGNTFYFPQVADGVDGRIQFQTALVFVNTGDDTPVEVEFFDSLGRPMAIPLGGEGPSARFELFLEKGGAFYAQSPGTQSGFRVGYARIRAGPGVDGTAIFTRTDTSTLRQLALYEAGVPATRAGGNFTFLLDSLGDQDTGIALVNAAEGLPGEADPAEVTLTLRNDQGFLIDRTTLDLRRGHHLARFVFQLFPDVAGLASEMRGIVTVESPVPIVALTLRQRDDPDKEYPVEVASLTPFPVMAPASPATTLYFPQVANGELRSRPLGPVTDRFQTGFIIANPGVSNSVVNLQFFDGQGEPWALNLGSGLVTGTQFALAPGRFRFLETTGAGGLEVGYARLTSSTPSVGGTAVFIQRSASHNNVTLFEAGVAATTPRRNFSLFLDSLGEHDTGLALVNATGEEAEVVVRLYDLESGLIAETTVEMAPNQHLPGFIHELFAHDSQVAELAREMRGVVTVESDRPLAAVTLRQNADPGRPFPTTIPTLTTFPVIAGVAER